MRQNVALWDRFLRFTFGVILLTWAIAGGPFWSYVGLIILGTAAWGICPVYYIFKLKTN